jgi:hypothetical protein
VKFTRRQRREYFDAAVGQPTEKRTLVTPCELHSGWRVDVSDGRPSPPPHLCPFCVREAQPATTRHEKVEVDPGDIGSTVSPTGWEIAERWWENHPERAALDKLEEESVLELIDLRRDEETASLEKRSRRAGILAGARWEDGVWTEYRAIPGRGIVRVGEV